MSYVLFLVFLYCTRTHKTIKRMHYPLKVMLLSSQMYLYLVSIFRKLVDACVLSPVKMFGKSQLLDFFCEGEWAKRYPWVRVSPEICQFTNFRSQNHTHTRPPISPLPLNQQPKSGHKTWTPINRSIDQSIEPSPFNAIIHHQVTTSHGTTC
jgi:hypothetical protein